MFKTDFRDTQRQFRDNKSKAWSESSLATKTQSVLYVKQNEKRKLKRDLLNFVSEMDTTHHELARVSVGSRIEGCRISFSGPGISLL